jgi:hypothetical protein
MLVQLILSSVLLGCQNQPLTPTAYTITDRTQTIGGPKAMAQPGDIILENEYLRAAIIGKRPSMGPHTDGGGLIDADIQRRSPEYANGHGNDQLAEIFATINMNVPRIDASNGSVEILSDGSDGTAVVCVVGDAKPFISLLDALWSVLQWKQDSEMPFDIRTDYILETNSPVVKMRTTALFGENEGCQSDVSNATIITEAPEQIEESDPSLIQIALDAGVAFGDFYLQGGSLNVFTPGIGFDEKSYVHELNLAGVNTFSDPILATFIAGTGTDISYGLSNPNGTMYIPLFTSSQTVGFGAAFEAVDRPSADDTDAEPIPEGYTCYNKRCFPEQIQYERWFTVGEGDVGSVLDHFIMESGVEHGTISGFVREEETGIAITKASVFVFACDESGTCDEAPYSQWLTDVGDDPVDDGSFGGTLPVGNYELLVHKQGRPDSDKIPLVVGNGSESTMVLGSPMPSTLYFNVWDDFERPLPAKISIFSVDDVDILNENFGDGYISGNPAAVLFASYGSGAVALPDGDYYAVASRGPEYELDISEPFSLSANRSLDLDFHLFRSVDTSGWISADFHVHSRPSHDSGVGYELRVSTMVAEGVEYFTGTDHDYITDFDPTIERMGLTEWVNSAPGLETTTIEVGHYIGFPVRIDNLSDSGGAIDWTGLRPQEMINEMRELIGPTDVEPVVFIGHPRDGILGYFDQYNLDPYGDNQGGYNLLTSLSGNLLAQANPSLDQINFSTDVDALELLNGKRFEVIRTPTQPELNTFATDDVLTSYDMNARTMEEQEAMANGEYLLGYGHEGQVDDWFTLLNLGYRFTALGNSDTHGTTTTESGCPRNFVRLSEDSPMLISDAAIAQAVKEHRIVASYGPFVEFYANGDPEQGVGSDVTTNNGDITFHIEVQSPSWFNVDRVELYENGTLIEEFTVAIPNDDIVNLSEDITLTPSKDSWYVVIAMGNDNLAPLYTAVEIPPVQLQDVVLEAFTDVELSFDVSTILDPLVPIPRSFDVIPFALTNPIWVDQNGDGNFMAPGLPEWLARPEDPTAE